MRLLSAVLYTALVFGANAAHADIAAAEAAREGTMKKLIFSDPTPVSTNTFTDPAGGERSLGDFEGKYVLVNFWATWCAPCRKEMPMLSEIQTNLGGETFEVVTIATGRNPQPAIDRFFEEIGVDNLPKYLDPRSSLARDMGVLGLPITLILDPEGREIARMRGDAEWNSESAYAVLEAILPAPEG
ncbi:MAG: TlpA family protein disulfide reductase [Boseongicola sp.]|nr:TlpA family protein disulfide reductase [Boseongicola sp.]NNJ67422.1 TlpA family protein disulfide reductase [Boseongicola sp.]